MLQARARQVVKGYEQGKLSKHIVGLKEGDTLDFKGPVMKLTYEPNMKKAIGMVCPVFWEPKCLFVQLTYELHFDKKNQWPGSCPSFTLLLTVCDPGASP